MAKVSIRGASWRGRVFWSGLDAAAGPISNILITAGLFRALGAESFGLIVVVQAFSMLALALNPAVSAATLRFVAVSRVQSDGGAGIRSALTSSLLLVVVVAVVLILCVGVFRSPLAGVLFGGVSTEEEARLRELALVLTISLIAFQQLETVCAAGLKGLERFSVQAAFEVCSKILIASVAVLVAYLSRSVVLVLLVQLLLVLVSGFARALILAHFLPGRRLVGRVSGAVLVSMLSFGGWMWLNATATAALGTVDRIVVNRLLGSAVAAEYHIYSQIIQFIHYVPTSVLAFVFPALSRLIAASDNLAEAQAIYRKTFLYSVVLGAMGVVTLLLFGRYAIYVISGELPDSRPDAFILLLPAYALLTCAIAPYYLLLAAGRSMDVSLVTAGSMVVALISLPFLVNTMQLSGAAVSRCLYALGVLILIFLARRWWLRSTLGKACDIRN